MNKKIKLCLCIVIAVFAVVSAGAMVYAEESTAPLYYIAFDNPRYHNAIGNAYGFDSVDYVEVTDSPLVTGAVRLMFEKSPYVHNGTYTSAGYKGEFDPYFYFPLYEIDEDILCSEAVSFVITLRVPEGANYSERPLVFFDTNENPWIDGMGDVFSAASSYQETTEFQNLVFNAPKGQWSGVLEALRLDPFERANDDVDYIDIAGIAFFGDRSAAKAFDGNYKALAAQNGSDNTKTSAILLSAIGCLIAAFGFAGELRSTRAKRIAALILAAVLCVGLFAACSGTSGEGDKNATAAPTEEPEEEPDLFVRSGENDEYRYDVYERHITITKYIGYKNEVTVPAEIEGLPVTVIGYKAFFRNYCYERQDAAHHAEIGVERLTLPDTIEIIEDYAFAAMEEVVEINFGSGLRVIGDNVVQNCYLLEEIDLSGTKLESIGAWAFTNCRIVKSIKLPDTVKSIDSGAFMCCRELENLTIPESAELGKGITFACPKLK